MKLLATVATEFAIEVEAALRREGRDDLASQVPAAEIERCTYDSSADAGYIYLVHPAPAFPFANLAKTVSETIPFLETGFNVDVDYNGNILGIELLSRNDVFAKLRQANAL